MVRPMALISDQLLADGAMIDGCLSMADGVIVVIDAAPHPDALVFDCRGLPVAPALVDMHGDAFERQVAPRPAVHFPLDAALLDTDR